MLDLLTEEQLNELFDENSAGTVYPVDNLTPKAKVPQMLHLRVPGTNDLVVRLTHLDTVGTRVKAVVPGDKTVQVFLMSLSDKGNITDFRGGLGSDPVGAINTIFTVVMDIAKKFRFESVLFRFTKNKMKGKSVAVQRILGRLIKNRSAGRFNTLEEVTRSESKKFDFVLAIRKNSDLVDELTKNAEGYTKVETKAGDVFVNDTTGENVSKAAVAAEVLTGQSAKITDQVIVSKSKVSRRDAMRALYSVVDSQADVNFHNTEEQQKHAEINADTPNVIKNPGPQAGIVDRVNRVVPDVSNLINVNSKPDDQSAAEQRLILTARNALRNEFGRNARIDSESFEPVVRSFVSDLGKKLEGINAINQQSRYEEIAELIETYPVFNELDFASKKRILSSLMDSLRRLMANTLATTYEEDANTDQMRAHFSEDECKTIREYSGQHFERINDYLIGKEGKLKAQVEEQIKILDGAFEKGMRVPKGTTLYRGQMLPWTYLAPILDKKIMYFRNYLSTSLLPIIYGGFSEAAVATAMSSDATDVGAMTSGEFIRKTVEPRYWDKEADDFTDKSFASKTMYSMGIVIKGADKVNTIIPGRLSSYASECEVILPRGTMLRVNKTSSNNLDVPEVTEHMTPQALMLLDTTVIAPEQIDESEGCEIIDGDLFLSEGVVKPIKVGSFAAMYTDKFLTEGTKNPAALNLLASCINLSELSNKFK